MRRKRRHQAKLTKLALPPCCLDYMRGTGTSQQCPQHEQRTSATYDHGLRLQRAQVFDELRDTFGAGASGPEQSWGIEAMLTANPDDGSTTDAGSPSKTADAGTSWLIEHENSKRSRR